LLVAGQSEYRVDIVQQKSAITLRVMGESGTEVFRGTLQAGHIDVSREIVASDLNVSGDPRCRDPLIQKAQSLRGDPDFRNFIRLDAAGDGTFPGKYQSAQLHCVAGEVRRLAPKAVD